ESLVSEGIFTPDHRITENQRIELVDGKLRIAFIEPVIIAQIVRNAMVRFQCAWLDLLPEPRSEDDDQGGQHADGDPLPPGESNRIGKLNFFRFNLPDVRCSARDRRGRSIVGGWLVRYIVRFYHGSLHDIRGQNWK